jgi:lysophospholipase L1-like esterase
MASAAFLGTSAFTRFDRDVLVQTGVKYVIVLEGNADVLIPGLIGNPAEEVTADQITRAHRQMIDRGQASGLRVYGGTLNPVEGYPFPGFWTAALRGKTPGREPMDPNEQRLRRVIDFEKLLRDPSHPSRLLTAYDAGDHVHPNDFGYRVMSDGIDLSLLRHDDEN